MSINRDRFTFFAVLVAVGVAVLGYLRLGNLYPSTGLAEQETDHQEGHQESHHDSAAEGGEVGEAVGGGEEGTEEEADHSEDTGSESDPHSRREE